MRLIDADVLIDDMVDYVVDGYAESRDDFEEYTKMVQTAPTIDAVEVVRCRYCKWADKCSRNVAMREIYEMYEEIYFCSYGERKESE